MSKSEITDLNQKIMDALFFSSRKMFEEKLKNNSLMAISYNGKNIIASASEIAKLTRSK